MKTAVDIVFEPNMKFVFVKSNADDLLALKGFIERGQLKPHIAHTFSLEQLTEAHRLMKKGSFVGKIGIRIDS